MGVDRNLIPFLGDKSTRKRLRELDKKFVSLMVVIGIGFSKIFEGFVDVAIQLYPVMIYGVSISMIFWWSIYTGFFVFLFLTEADKMAKDQVDEAKETVGEAKEAIEEKIED